MTSILRPLEEHKDQTCLTPKAASLPTCLNIDFPLRKISGSQDEEEVLPRSGNVRKGRYRQTAQFVHVTYLFPHPLSDHNN